MYENSQHAIKFIYISNRRRVDREKYLNKKMSLFAIFIIFLPGLWNKERTEKKEIFYFVDFSISQCESCVIVMLQFAFTKIKVFPITKCSILGGKYFFA